MKRYWRLDGFGRMIVTVVAPQVLVIVAAVTVMALGYTDPAQMIGLFGSFGAMMLSLLWVVLVDSRERWPGMKARHRYAKIVTFSR